MRITFERDLIQAARHYIGRPTVVHQRFAGNCLEKGPSSLCMQSGLGPDGFDCSGLVIAALCDVLDMPTRNWPESLRHVRDMWDAVGEPDNNATRWPAGTLVVMHRRWEVRGVSRIIPGHIVLVTDEAQQGYPPMLLHASSRGEVQERRFRSSHTVLGSIALERLLFTATQDHQAHTPPALSAAY